MSASAPTSQVDELLGRAAQLERELLDLERQLTDVGAGTSRAGLHLVVEVGKHRVLLEARGVVQITRVVEFAPILGAPEAVLGGFVRRGQAGVAVDLARVLGATAEADLDAHLVIVGGTRLMGLVVDRVRHVVEAPTRIDPRAERLLPDFRAELVAGWCDVGGWFVPLLAMEAIERLALEQPPGGGDGPTPAGEEHAHD